jgi:hypothetical protein
VIVRSVGVGTGEGVVCMCEHGAYGRGGCGLVRVNSVVSYFDLIVVCCLLLGLLLVKARVK